MLHGIIRTYLIHSNLCTRRHLMAITTFDVDSIKQSIAGKLQRYNGITVAEATPQQLYKAVASTVRDQIMQKWMISREKRHNSKSKRLYYLSVEFLTGRSPHIPQYARQIPPSRYPP